MQLTHYQSKFSKQIFPIVLVCDSVIKAPNIGSMLRIADAFGIERVVFCGEHIPIGKRMTKTSRSTEKYVNFEIHHDATKFITSLKTNDFKIISIEITAGSIPLNQFKLPTNQPIAIVLGSENFGVNKNLLELSDHILHIEMFGHNSSMSVVQAASIALYEITNQFCKIL
jgi:tRNA G18 (ribose-2'-O)-methylase SpoU